MERSPDARGEGVHRIGMTRVLNPGRGPPPPNTWTGDGHGGCGHLFGSSLVS